MPYVRQPEEFVPGQSAVLRHGDEHGGIATGSAGREPSGTADQNRRKSAASRQPGGDRRVHAGERADALRSGPVASRYASTGIIDTWVNFMTALSGARDVAGLKKGAGFRILTGTVTSPTLAAQIQEFLTAYPQAKWHQYEPCGRHTARAGVDRGVRQAVEHHLPVRSRECDRFAGCGFSVFRDAGRIALCPRLSATAQGRGRGRQRSKPPRLYVAEGTPSITGGMAEHRFRMRTSEVEAFAACCKLVPATGVAAVMKDLNANRGASIVIAGEHQPPRVHAMAHAMNAQLGNVGKTVIYTDPVEANPVDELASLAELVKDMRLGSGGYVADPRRQSGVRRAGGSEFSGRAEEGEDRGRTLDCIWMRPRRGATGTCRRRIISNRGAMRGRMTARLRIVQPLIAPIYDGKTAHEVINVLLNRQGDDSTHETVRAYWQAQHKGADFDDFWQISLHDGVVAGTAFAEINAPAAQSSGRSALRLERTRNRLPSRSRGGRRELCRITPGFRKCPSPRTR